jgi:Asp-tRNA(Asn)/Glu-tRNA(Gln) amidotransferase A subunit family amidase
VQGGGEYGAAAAVTGGLADLALTIDELGSARVPAACCGAYALRTSVGVLPLEGAATASASLAAATLLATNPLLILRAGQALRLPGGECARQQPASMPALVAPCVACLLPAPGMLAC